MERVAEGERRARYTGTWLGPLSEEALAHAGALSEALAEMEALALAPLLGDGAVAGNGALRLPSGGWITSVSARRPGEVHVAEIVSFDRERFAISYRSGPGREPTSDVAMHACALFDPEGARRALASLHGHALETEHDAARLALPISERETTFGTREDMEATEALLARAPYPAQRAWIRRGHGFLVAAASMDEARALVRTLAALR
jgi:hypothetical protein